MTGPLRLWLRRGTATAAFPAMVAIEVVILFSRNGWSHEWDWALAQAAAGTMLLAPLVAGLVAFDRARRIEPTLALLALGAPRGTRAVSRLPVAAWLAASTAWLIGVIAALIIAWRGGAGGLPGPFAFVEPPVLLLTACFVGLAIGSGTRSVLAGPAAAAIVFALRILASYSGLHLDGVFAAGGSAGSMMALDRTPQMALTLMASHLALAGLAAAFATARLRPMMLCRSGVAVGAAAFATVASLATYSSTGSRLEPLRWTSSPRMCARGAVTVCGPSKGVYLLKVAQRSLSAAEKRLEPSGITWQAHYVLMHGPAIGPGDGVLSAGPDQIHDGRLDIGAVVATLMNPRLCSALFDDRRAQSVLDDQTQVMEWLTATLRSTRPVEAAPQSVKDAYRRLETCPPFTGRLP